jgi:hypothetical protein
MRHAYNYNAKRVIANEKDKGLAILDPRGWEMQANQSEIHLMSQPILPSGTKVLCEVLGI